MGTKIKVLKNKKLTVRFYFKSSARKDEKQALFIRVRLGREYESKLTTGISGFKAKWDANLDLFTNDHPEHETLNSGLLEWKKRIGEAIAKFEVRNPSKPFNFYMACDHISGKTDATSLENYVESYYKENYNSADYENYRDRLRYFKAVLGIKNDLMFDDVNNALFGKFKRIADRNIKEGKKSAKTYAAYLQAVLSICNEAYLNRHIHEEVTISSKNKRFRNIDYGENPSNSTKEILDAIDSTHTIQRWEAIAQWVLMFGMRGFYPADVVKMAEKDLYKHGHNGKRMPYVKVNKNLLSDWSTANFYLDFRRSKTSLPMFIKLNRSVIELIEKLKYSYMYTHADYQIDGQYIVNSINDRLTILNYNITDNYKEHKSLWRNRQKLLATFSENVRTFKTPRKTYYQLADDLSDELTAKKLVGQTTDSLSKNFYSKYNTEVQVEKLDKVHDEVLREFRFSEVVSKLVSKFYEIVNSGGAPTWLLKQSAVHKDGTDWKVFTGRVNRKNQWATIPKKYKRFFDDKSMDEDYWDDLTDAPYEVSIDSVRKTIAKVQEMQQKRLENERKIEQLKVELKELVAAEEYDKCAEVKANIEVLEGV